MDDNANMRIRRLIQKRQRELQSQNLSLPSQNTFLANPSALQPAPQPTPTLSSPSNIQGSSVQEQLQSASFVPQAPSTSSTLSGPALSFNPNERRGGFRTFERNQQHRSEPIDNPEKDNQPLHDLSFDDQVPPLPPSSSSSEEHDNLFIINDEPFDPRPNDRFLNSFELKYMQLCLDLNLTEHASSRILNFIKECNIDEARASKS